MSLNLAQRLLAVSKELGWIDKAGKNKDQGYDFVRAVDVFAAARDALSKHGVVWMFQSKNHTVDVLETPKGTRYLHKVTGDYSLINADDPKDVITGTVEGFTVASGDKGLWVATTGMLKYALIQIFLLPTGDDPEAQDEDTDKPARAQSAPKAPEAVKATTVKVGLTETQKKKLFATFDEAGLKETESRRYFIKALTGKQSTKDMTGDDLDKVLTVLGTKDNDTEELIVKAMAAAA